MAASGRNYTVSFSNVVISQVQDLVAIYANGMPFRVLEAWLSQSASTTTSGVSLVLKTLPAVTTQGSGGNVVTPQKYLLGDSTPTVIAHINDTTQAVSSGTASVVRQDAWNITDPYLWNPVTPDDGPTVPAAGAFVFSMTSAPTSPQTVTVSGGLVIQEIL